MLYNTQFIIKPPPYTTPMPLRLSVRLRGVTDVYSLW